MREIKHTSMNYTIYGISYIYDLVGNRLADTDLVSGDTRYFEYDADNRMLRAGNDTFTFDLAGNMTSMFTDRGLTTYTWDYENRLTQINFADSDITSCTYDGEGKRIFRNKNGEEIKYVWNPQNYNEFAEYDNSGNQKVKYGQTLDIDNQIFQLRGDTYSYYHFDGLGSVMNITSENEIIQNAYKYKGFGASLSKSENIENEFQYTARRNDNNGLYYYRSRYYIFIDFLSKDEWVGDFEIPLTLNKFNYGYNNPIINVDPTGFITVDKSCGRKAAYIKKMAEKAQRVAKKCIPSGGGFNNNVQNKFNNLVIKCDNQNGCGHAPASGNRITLSAGAFNGKSCGILQTTILHEVIHTTGRRDEKTTDGCEKKCYGYGTGCPNDCK